MKINLKHT